VLTVTPSYARHPLELFCRAVLGEASSRRLVAQNVDTAALTAYILDEAYRALPATSTAPAAK